MGTTIIGAERPGICMPRMNCALTIGPGYLVSYGSFPLINTRESGTSLSGSVIT